MKKYSFRQRFQYWFDNQMSQGSRGLISILIISTVFLVLVFTFLLHTFGGIEDFFESFWNSLNTLLNAWVPDYPEAEEVAEEVAKAVELSGSQYRQLFILLLDAIIGILLTSVLIGVVTSMIEEKIMNLKRGNSIVLEEGHTVVLGFHPGEYTLIRQLVLAAADKPYCIVVAGDTPKDEMEESIHDNVEIPDNVRIICRSLDIYDPNAIERLGLETAKTIIIHPTDDMHTVKALLAVSKIINNSTNDKVRVGAIISKEEYRLPPTAAVKHNVTALQTHRTIAKIIAHSCTQPGISEVFKEIFNFEGNELYFVQIPDIEGMTFMELMGKLDYAVPVGIQKDDLTIVNPSGNSVLKNDYKILIFSETKKARKLIKDKELKVLPQYQKKLVEDEEKEKVLIIGKNETLHVILRELPENISEVYVANAELTEKELGKCNKANPYITLSFIEDDISTEEGLLEVIKDFEHIVILSSHSEDEEQDDMVNTFLLLNLRDLRTRYNLNFNITAEMRRENNQALVVEDDFTDFVVSSNMSSLFLAQLAESPELYQVFTELLSNDGNEVYLKKAHELNCTGNRTIGEYRQIVLSQGYIMLGYRKRETNESVFNPPLDEEVTLNWNDFIIVVGEN